MHTKSFGPTAAKGTKSNIKQKIGSRIRRRLNQTFPNPLFQHERINMATGQIRLFRLLPNRDARGLIQCEVSVVNLADAPAYQAISYEWGPRRPTRRLLVNGAILRIRRNLWLFLDMFRHRTMDNTSLIWADQVCIDQSNTAERNHQVQLMGELFSRADRVLAWLGPAHGVFTEIESLVRTHMEYFETACFANCRQDHQCDCKPRDRDDYGFEHVAGRICYACYAIWQGVRQEKALLDISHLSYWTRLWIIQELVLAKQVILFVGQTKLSTLQLVKFYELMDQFGQLNYPLGQPSREVSRVLALIGLDRNVLSANLSWLDALSRLSFKHLKCTEPRDLIFGLLGLVSTSERIPIDYKLDKGELLLLILEKIVFNYRLRETTQADNSLNENLDELAQEDRLGLPTHWHTRLEQRSYTPVPREWQDFPDNLRSELRQVVQARQRFEPLDLRFKDFLHCVSALEESGFDKHRWRIDELAAIVQVCSRLRMLPDGGNDWGEWRDYWRPRSQSIRLRIEKLAASFNAIDVWELPAYVQEIQRGGLTGF